MNPYTLQHEKYPNIFAFGDCAKLDTTRSAWSALNQSVVIRNNLWDYLHGNQMRAVYTGYSSFELYFSLNRIWIFKHMYNYLPTTMNFYVPKFLGFPAYKLKSIFDKNYLSKIYSSKINFSYPYIMKDRYFRPLAENKFIEENKLSMHDLFPHKNEKPVLSFEQKQPSAQNGENGPELVSPA